MKPLSPKNLLSLGALFLGMLMVGSLAHAKSSKTAFPLLSHKQLMKKSPKQRLKYVRQRARYMAAYETFFNKWATGQMKVPKKYSMNFMKIFAGATANAQGDTSFGAPLVAEGQPCPAGGYISIWGKQKCGVKPCTTTSGKPGGACKGQYFGYDLNEKEFCQEKSQIRADFTQSFCLPRSEAQYDGKNPEEQKKVLERNLNIAKKVDGDDPGKPTSVKEKEVIAAQESEFKNSCALNARAISRITGKQEDPYNCAGEKGKSFPKFKTAVQQKLEATRCSCFTLREAQLGKEIPPPPPKKEATFLVPIKCIKDAFADQGHNVSDKYLALMAASVQAFGRGIDAPTNAKPGSYTLKMDSQTEDVQTNYRYEGKKHIAVRDGLRRPEVCSQNKEKFGQTHNQLFLRRMAEHLESKGWCDNFGGDDWASDLSDADNTLLTNIVAGTEYVDGKSTKTNNPALERLDTIFDVTLNNIRWQNAFALQTKKRSMSTWNRQTLLAREQAWKGVHKSKFFGLGHRGMSSEPKACMQQSYKKGRAERVNLCLQIAQNCGLSPAICNKKHKCLDVSGFKKSGDSEGATKSGTRYSPDIVQ